ncbi:MAG TPA: PAS domain S-box protein [Woeseiaceae bacterium]|nr:PAS domain S-box protein [Woeseiaceae bacterium]
MSEFQVADEIKPAKVDKSSKNADSILRAEYFRLLDTLPAAAYACDAAGLITHFNQRAADLWGREPKLNEPTDRFCGSVRLLSPDGAPIEHHNSWMALAIKEDRSYDGFDVVIERPDGSRVFGVAHVHPLHDESGRLIGAVNVVVDVSERKRGEEAQGRLVAIVESADDAIIGKDLNGIITDWNAGAERLFGYSAREAIGQPVSMLIPADRLNEEPDILGRIRNGDTISHYETIRRGKDGTLLNISLSVSPIHDANRKIIGASKIARNIAAQKKMEEALLEADRRKDEFLAMLSHELRNPLATIRNSVQLLRMDPGHAMQRKVLAPLERQVSTLTRLVDDLMDVSRVTMGRVELQRSDVHINRILRDAAESVRRDMRDRGHSFKCSIPAVDIVVHADAVRLEQVVVNLLTNAAKYTPDGGLIELTAEHDGEDAVVRVRDSGMGIRPEHLEQVFALFSQGATTLDRSKGGLGIGLALVKHVVEMHGGSVRAMSDGPGTGSEFIVRLPAAASSAPSKEAPQDAADKSDGTHEHALRVLVVDDNRDSADLQATLLQHNGHSVRTAYDGTDALEVAAKFRPDVILLDIGLPEIDGYEVAYRVRQQPDLDGVVLVAMTGYGQPEDRQRSQAVGFDHHLVKPAEFADLQSILASVQETKVQRV